jgi:UDP-N-acetylmuramyl-tripeptide synthetase
MKNLIRKFIPKFLLSWYHLGLAFAGALLYRFPSKRMKVIGITGTNGKSTVADMTTKILEEAGYNVAAIYSIKFKIGDKEWPNTLKMTMPGRLKLQRFLKKALDHGCQYAVIEVTSEGILQHRHRFIDFDIAVFTNLTPEHIESHGSFEKYKEAKGRLFQALENSKKKKTSIINLDDKNAEYFLKFSADQKIGYGIDNDISSFVKATKVKLLPDGVNFVVQNTPFYLKLLGHFNVSNALAAISAGLSQDIDLEVCKKALEKIDEVSGRMERVIEEPFKVFVDYAHTPDALLKAYSALPGNPKKICVLGSCGGIRDKWKRPELGRIADKFCSQIILTNEDPYDEEPNQILNQIEAGIKNKKVIKILDRREAIKEALSLAKANNIVIITGKGSEPWMCVKGGKKIPWDDRKIVKEEFKKLKL